MVEEFDDGPEPGPGRRWFASWVGVGLALGALLTAGTWWIVRPAPPRPMPTVACSWRPAPITDSELHDVGTPPSTGNPRGGTATMRLDTNLGVIAIAMDQQNAPCTVASFRYLAGRRFFDGSQCHRLTTARIFVLQCGDPTATGQGGPTYQYDDEHLPSHAPGGTAKAVYRRGTVAMANSGPDTNGSQFFIAYQDSTILPYYTVLGMVTSGLDLVDRVAAGGVPPDQNSDGRPLTPLMLNSVTVSP